MFRILVMILLVIVLIHEQDARSVDPNYVLARMGERSIVENVHLNFDLARKKSNFSHNILFVCGLHYQYSSLSQY
jgi:hypothetical protein